MYTLWNDYPNWVSSDTMTLGIRVSTYKFWREHRHLVHILLPGQLCAYIIIARCYTKGGGHWDGIGNVDVFWKDNVCEKSSEERAWLGRESVRAVIHVCRRLFQLPGELGGKDWQLEEAEVSGPVRCCCWRLSARGHGFTGTGMEVVVFTLLCLLKYSKNHSTSVHRGLLYPFYILNNPSASTLHLVGFW